jgi:hypothetical protein
MNAIKTNKLVHIKQECREWLTSINQSIDEGDLIAAAAKDIEMSESLTKMIPDDYIKGLHGVYYTYHTNPFNSSGQEDNLRRLITTQIIFQEMKKMSFGI